MYMLSFKEFCERTGLTIDQIIAVTGVSFQTVINWQSGGNINRDQASKILKLARPHCSCGFTHWASEPDNCVFFVE